MRLQDKIAIVTGTGAGMGKAIVLRFAAEGAHVVGAEIDEVMNITGQSYNVDGGLMWD